jgi:hypothetical protein
MLHLARPTLPPFLSPLVNPRRTSSSTALNAFCPIFCFPLPSRLSLVWLSSSCYTPLGFFDLVSVFELLEAGQEEEGEEEEETRSKRK